MVSNLFLYDGTVQPGNSADACIVVELYLAASVASQISSTSHVETLKERLD